MKLDLDPILIFHYEKVKIIFEHNSNFLTNEKEKKRNKFSQLGEWRENNFQTRF